MGAFKSTSEGQALQKRLAGSIDTDNFFYSKTADTGTDSTNYNPTGLNPVTKSLRSRYMNTGAKSLESLDKMQG
jgi:hypothetical protein